MKVLYRLSILFAIALTIISAGSVRQKPLNLILFIGDGMGVSHVYAAMTVSGNTMTFPSFPVTGFSKTHSANSYSTDSAAGGTALSTGEKTNNRMISMRPDSTVLVTLLEHARAAGKSTGIVCTSSLTDATPASFAAHVPLRYNYRDIAEWYVSGAAEVFVGGGRKYFEPEVDSSGNYDRSEDVVSMLKRAGYDVTYDLGSFLSSGAGRIAGLLSPEDMPRLFEGRDPQYLARATAKALEVLSRNRKGFVLMVEGSEIDDAGHSNSTSMVTEEVLDLDRAVAVAYDFALKNGNTLIVVTADHETGGMSITAGDLEKKEVTGSFSFKGHSGVMVPVFAYGPGAIEFTGIQENTDLFHDFFRLLSLDKKRK
ncbi:MAG: alkaline phosphatase [Bacteroidales bacterium]|nr:alkaline phosphatase [Bacteroidales bacterium]